MQTSVVSQPIQRGLCCQDLRCCLNKINELFVGTECTLSPLCNDSQCSCGAVQESVDTYSKSVGVNTLHACLWICILIPFTWVLFTLNIHAQTTPQSLDCSHRTVLNWSSHCCDIISTAGIVTVVSPIGPRWFCQQSLNCGAAFVSLRSPDLKSTKDDSQGVWAQGRQESRIYRQGTGEQLRRKLKGLLRGTLCLFKTIKNTVRTTVEG